ncbi:MAG: diacylglycerol kinase family protein [Elainellaceae cyanobacterium]
MENIKTTPLMAQDMPTKPSSQAQTPQEAPDRELAWQVASNLFVSFKYAGAGLTYAFRTQRNFRIHVVLGSVAIALSLYFQLSSTEIAIMGLTVGGVLTMELINTALESVVDLTVQQTYHELAKIAKDCAAGAVLISAVVSILVAGVLLVPPLLERFSWL